ncbi:hypothetical protein D3C71_2227910 [compost metagenome]
MSFDLGIVVPEITSLLGAGRRHILRIEVEHYFLAAQITKLNGLAFSRLEAKVRSRQPFFH